MRKFIHPGQSIGLSLTAKERHLLINDCLVIDNTYLDRIREAPTGKPQVSFTLDELDDLAGFVAFEANHVTDKAKQKAFDNVCQKIQRLLATHTDDEEEARKDVLKEVEAAGIDPKQFDPMRMFMAEFEAMGVNVDALLEQMKPKMVTPEERIPVPMSATEKPLVMGIEGLDADIRREIVQTPLKKRTVALTLQQVNVLAKLVDSTSKTCADKKLVRKWQSIVSALTDVQTHYADGTEPTLKEALAGKPSSSGAMVRQMFQQMLEERKKQSE